MNPVSQIWLLLLAGLLAPFRGFAQPAETPVRVSSQLKLAYTGSLIYPGIRIGVETPVGLTQLTEIRRSGTLITRYKERFLAVSLGGYHHPTFHDNLYATIDWLTRRTRRAGFFTELSPGVGYSRTFLGGPTYRVDGSGQVTTRPLAGHSYMVVTLGAGLGYDFGRSRPLPLSVVAKANVLVLLPYNNFLYARPTLDVGVIYKPKRFLSRSIRPKKKQT